MAKQKITRWLLITAVPLAIVFVIGVILVILAFSQEANKYTGTDLKVRAAEVERYTGLNFPAGCHFINYSVAPDERFFKAMMTDAEVNHLVASAVVTPMPFYTDEAQGMLTIGIGSWWQPQAILSPECYEGDLQGTTNAHGRFFIIAEPQGPANRTVYVYFFKT